MLNRRMLGGVVALVLLAGCGKQPAPPKTLEPVTLQFSWSVSPEHAAFLLGQKEVFPKYGIDLKLEPSRGSNETLKAIAAKKYPFVIASAESLVITRIQGVPVRSVLQLYRDSPAVAFTIDGSKLASPSDLVGKKVGVITTSTVTTQFRFMLESKGLAASDAAGPDVVQLVPATQGGAAQLEAGQINVLTHYTNYAPAQFMAHGKPVSELFFRDNGVDTYSAGIVTTDDIIKTRKDLVQRFVCATIESLELAQAQPDRALAAYRDFSLKETGAFDEAYARESLKRTNALLMSRLQTHRPGFHEQGGWRRTLEAVRASGMADIGSFDPSFLFDASFFRAADGGKACDALKK